MEAFDVLFVELDEVDPTGVSFRYYRRLDGRLSLASASGMPLRYLATDGLARKVDELDVFLDGMRDEFDLREWSFSDMLMDHSM